MPPVRDPPAPIVNCHPKGSTMLEIGYRGADLSADGVYRYSLVRRWTAARPTLPIVMLNPSTADAEVDDRTIGRCVSFADAAGYGAIRVVNLYAARTTRPVHLFDGTIPDPVGPRNDAVLEVALRYAALAGVPALCAWGSNAAPDRVAAFGRLTASILPLQLVALHVNADGSPKHPLYVKGGTVLQSYEVPR